MDFISLNGKVILISGASSGIGRSTALLCSKYGSKVIILGRNSNRLEDTYNNLFGDGHKMIVSDITLDVSEIVDQIPKIDGFVNAAGIIMLKPFKFLTDLDLDNIFSVNFRAPLKLTQSLLKKKKFNKDASVVFISSLAGNVIASKGNTAYSASKSALNAMVRTLALEVASSNLRVNAILPGMVKTEMIKSFLESLTSDQLEEDEKKYPLGYGEPEDVANAALFLLSKSSRWITGSSLIIDGGLSIQ
jgi:NAD(P)-dependent dehydrogenase (short-subunit alcohol dehydrogenase family)